MAQITNYTLNVLSPESRLQKIRPSLSEDNKVLCKDDVIGIFVADDYDGHKSRSERLRRLEEFLQAGEYAAVVSFNNTADLGTGWVFQKQGDETVKCVYKYSEDSEFQSVAGRKVMNQIHERFGFRPVRRYSSQYPQDS